ncbi:MAG: hypothetical protein ACKPKO_57240, partial [Candidatus Fonsibacter sp.]
FCNYWDDKVPRSFNVNKSDLVGIPSGKSMTVAFSPLSGLLRQKNFIPLKYAPRKIELSLVGTTSDPSVTLVTAGEIPSPLPADNFNFYTASTSTTWSIQKPTKLSVI